MGVRRQPGAMTATNSDLSYSAGLTRSSLTASPVPPPPASIRGRRGEGTQRERRPGIWEIRIPIAPDPASGRRRQISLTVTGTVTDAEARRAELLAWHRDRPHHLDAAAPGAGGAGGAEPLPPPSRVTLGQLLGAWLAADHPWKPSTYVGYRSNVRALATDPISECRAQVLTPQQVRHRLRAWESDGASLAVRGGRFRALRACLSWAYNERLIDTHPIRLMRGPGRTEPRRPLAQGELHALLLTAELRLLEAQANHREHGYGRSAVNRIHRAEQGLLLVRLAADTGERRGELTALRFSNLTASIGQATGTRGSARTLHIERAISAGQITSPKSGHGRTLTLGADTAALWHRLQAAWTERHLDSAAVHAGERSAALAAGLGPWVFTSDLAHERRVGPEVLGHRFAHP